MSILYIDSTGNLGFYPCILIQYIYNGQHMKTLAAKKRDITKSNESLRKEGFVPAVVYGGGIENINVSVLENETRKIWRDVKNTETFTLDTEGTKHKVIMTDMQVHVVTGDILHIDFLVQK